MDEELKAFLEEHQITITLLKHSAVVEWPDLPGVCPSGRLTVHTEDPLAEDQTAREAAHEALYALTRLIEAGASSVSVIAPAEELTTDPIDGEGNEE